MLADRADRALRELVAHLAAAEGTAPRVLSPAEDLPLELVRSHGLAALAYRAGYDELHPDHVGVTMWAEARAAALTEVVDALAAAGLRPVLHGPTAFTGAIYDADALPPADPAQLLIAPADHRRALAVVEGLGFAPGGVQAAGDQAPVQVTRPPVTLILHRALPGPLPGRLDLEPLLERALPAVDRRDAAWRLHPADEALVALAGIAGRLLLAPLIQYVHAARLLARPGVGRERVRERARQLHLGRAVDAAAEATRALATGADQISWPDRAMAILPDPREIAAGVPPSRPLALLRRLVLAGRPRQVAYLAARTAWTRLRG